MTSGICCVLVLLQSTSDLGPGTVIRVAPHAGARPAAFGGLTVVSHFNGVVIEHLMVGRGADAE